MPKKRKPANTASQRQLADDWEKLKAKWASVPPLKISVPGSKKKPAQEADVYIGIQHTPREGEVVLQQLKTRSHTTPGGSTAPAKQRVYTGDKMLGIATMHKSSSVPVFSADEAKDISKMRR